MPNRRAAMSRRGMCPSASRTNEIPPHGFRIMKIIKYTLYTLGGLIALVVIAIAVAVALFDPNRYKGELAKIVKEKTGRTLAVEGKIGLSLYPSIGVAVGRT